MNEKKLSQQISLVIKIWFRIVWNVHLVNAFDSLCTLSKCMKHNKMLSMCIFFLLPLKTAEHTTDVYVNIWKSRSLSTAYMLRANAENWLFRWLFPPDIFSYDRQKYYKL